jgi:hypothetical protein
MSTNLLYVAGWPQVSTGFTAGAGAGVDYHFLSRHFSIGLRGGYYWLKRRHRQPDLITTLYLRYTF